MITIPTGDLTGILADCIPFAHTDDDLPALNCVRLEWDGEVVHAQATDRFRIAWSQWENGDIDADGDVQEDLFTQWGGADDPWRTTIKLDDAKELVSVFKLPAKERSCPLVVDYDQQRDRLKVSRARETGHSSITLVAEGSGVEFPDIPGMLAKADASREPIMTVAYTAKLLADFAKVRPRGPLTLAFGTAATRVTVGERFVGAIMPVRSEEPSEG